MIQLEPGVEGPFNVGFYTVSMPTGRQFAVRGPEAALISMLLAGYKVTEDFKPFEAFTGIRVVSDDQPVEAVGGVPDA